MIAIRDMRRTRTTVCSTIVPALMLSMVGSITALALDSTAPSPDAHGAEVSGHDHGAQAELHDADDALLIHVTRDQVERFGIKIATAVKGTMRQEIQVPGEIRLNADRIAHVVPRAAGIVRAVEKTLGDRVAAGDVLAWIESDELAKAKLDFYAKESEVACCEIELPRAKAIYENVAELIELLGGEQAPSEEAIHKLDGLEMGAYRGQLLTAHAAYRAAKTVYRRERDLRDKQISSAQDLLTAETELKQARANLHARLDTARYETLIAYTEAARERQVAVFDAAAAEQKLRLKGADDALVSSLRALVPRPASLEPCPCDDPECREGELPSVAESLRKDDRFAWYGLRSPFDGTIVEEHIALGESIDTSSDVFSIADLSSVWVDLAINQDALTSVRQGYPVTVRLPGGATAEAKIAFVSPTIDSDTRTAPARVVLDNSSGTFRPGTFVEAAIGVPSQKEAVVIPKASIQRVHDHTCVFVWTAGAFEMREIVAGAADGDRIEVLRGLEPGEKVAAVNAFHLKAEMIKSQAGDPGAHHGHSH